MATEMCCDIFKKQIFFAPLRLPLHRLHLPHHVFFFLFFFTRIDIDDLFQRYLLFFSFFFFSIYSLMFPVTFLAEIFRPLVSSECRLCSSRYFPRQFLVSILLVPHFYSRPKRIREIRRSCSFTPLPYETSSRIDAILGYKKP